jgi:hypothetical protein
MHLLILGGLLLLLLCWERPMSKEVMAQAWSGHRYRGLESSARIAIRSSPNHLDAWGGYSALGATEKHSFCVPCLTCSPNQTMINMDVIFHRCILYPRFALNGWFACWHSERYYGEGAPVTALAWFVMLVLLPENACCIAIEVLSRLEYFRRWRV